MPMPDPAFTRLHVLSDLHLAPADGPCVFRAHERLVALLGHLAAGEAGAALVLNGDVFDFLQIPGYDGLSLPLAARRMTQILDALDGEPGSRNVVGALRAFTQAGHRLYCLPGNHDPELHLHAVQAVLQARLGSRPPAELAGDDALWQARVGDTTVLGAHGHAGDAFNAISGRRMQRAERSGDADVPLPPGSRLVLEVINPYRRAHDQGTPRFPFVDLLPSDHAVVLALLLLDPALAMRRLTATFGIGRAVLVRNAMLKTGIGAKRLSADPHARPAASTADAGPEAQWLDALASRFAEELDDAGDVARDRLRRELQAHLDGHGGAHRAATERGHPMLDPGDAVRTRMLRALGKEAQSGHDAFRPQVADALADASIAAWDGRADILLTGHTHAAKQLRTPRGGTYLNTGTWLDLTPVPSSTDADTVSAWLDALAADTAPRWQGCPVARIDADGARLLHWTGSDFRAWSDGLPAPAA
jgi:UDP-2,3-diacylglucosamine pyrophosphatase LpxH